MGFFPVFLPVVGIVALAIFALRSPLRERGPGGYFRRRVVPVASAILGVLLLTLLIFGTVHDLRASYRADGSTDNPTLRFPTQPPTTEEEARVQMHVILAENLGWGYRPIQAHTLEFDWRGNRMEPFEIERTIRGARYKVTVDVESLRRQEGVDTIKVRGDVRVKDFNMTLGTSYASTLVGRQPGILTHQTLGRTPGRFLSLNPSPKSRLHVIGVAHRVSRDDPMREVALDDYVAGLDPSALVKRKGWVDAIGNERSSPAPGLAYISWVGLGGVTLLVGALLLAQLFPRRQLAFVAVIFGAVTFGIAVDRWILSTHLARLGNPELGPHARAIAADSLAHTFFFRSTAREAAIAAMEDESCEPSIRKAADVAHRRIDQALGREN